MGKPRFLSYLRFFCAGAIAVSVALDYSGVMDGVQNFWLSSAGGVGALVAAKKLALVV